jgi:molybdenum cofactor cytidylyltransferase
MTGLLDLKLGIALPAAPAGIRVTAVILAAGSSRRMGGPAKLLLDIAGKPMIRRTVENVLASAPVETVVVTGDRAAEVEAAVAGLPLTVVRNPRHAEGQPTSVAAGVAALRHASDLVMVVLGDQPQIGPDDFRALVEAYRTSGAGSILVPFHDGQRGNPVLFATRHIPDVIGGGLNVGCRRLIETHGDRVARVAMASDVYTVDCDTPDDYARLVARLGEGER